MDLPKAFPKNHSFKNLKTFRKDPLAYMQLAAKNHGTPVDLHLPMGDFVILDNADQFAEVFKDERTHYAKSRGYKEIALVLGNGLLTAEGETWRQQRKALQPSFHKNELRQLLPYIWDTGQGYVNALKGEEKIRLDTEMSGLTMTILLNSLIKYQDSRLVERMSQHIHFGQDFIVDRIRSPFKWPVWIPTATNRKYHHMMEEANELIQKCVDDRKAYPEQVGDLLDVLMDTYHPDEQFSEIRNQLLTFLVAGHETSAIAMTWTLHSLAHHPEIQEKVYQEVKSLGTLSDLDVMDFSNTTYTQQVIKESLRYYPPIWNVVRRAIKDHEIAGHHIPKGKQLMLNIYLLHHNEKYWHNPDSFMPERFEKGHELSHKLQYMPFGGGGRFCIGNNFAIYEIMLLLIQFVRHYEFTPCTPKQVPFNPLLTLRPAIPVEVGLKPRGAV